MVAPALPPPGQAAWPRIPTTLLVMVLVAVSVAARGAAQPFSYQVKRVQIVSADQGRVRLEVQAEVADTDEKQTRGLMYRRHLPRHAGMLFIFGEEVERSFWMLNTYVPLDMIFADSGGRITTIHEQVPPCPVGLLNCPTYPSRGPARYVLEINGGLARQRGVRPGDYLRF